MKKAIKKKAINYKETRLVLQLSRDLKKQIRDQARRKHLSLNSLIRLAIGEWLEQEQSKGKK